jgi:hypothetical protein
MKIATTATTEVEVEDTISGNDSCLGFVQYCSIVFIYLIASVAFIRSPPRGDEEDENEYL